MTAARLIQELARHDIRLFTDGEQLRIRAPRGTLTPELRSKLALHRQDILAALRSKIVKNFQTALLPDRRKRFEPFPLTDIQRAYYVGRSGDFDLGNVACHAYYEVESLYLDLPRLALAFRKIIERHDMLRAIVLPDGRQQVLEHVPPYQIAEVDLRGRAPEEAADHLESIRRELSHQVLPLDRWPLFDIRATLLDGGVIRLHISIDILIADVRSLQIIFREWQNLYDNPAAELPSLKIAFRDYVMAQAGARDADDLTRSLEYWKKRAPALPPAPELPLAVSPASIAAPRFVRRAGRLSAAEWISLKRRAGERGLTPSAVLLAAFCEVISRWCKHPRFTINVTQLGRKPLHPQVNELVGDFTSLIPLEVDLTATDSFDARAGRIYTQMLEDLEHARVCGVEVMRESARTQRRAAATLPIVFTSLLGGAMSGHGPSNMLWMGDVVYGITQTPQTWLDHQVFEQDGGLVFNWDGVEALFPEGLLQDMFDAYSELIAMLAANNSAWHRSEVGLLPERQLKRIESLNATQADVPVALLQDLFQAQARLYPDREAVASEYRRLSYSEVDRISNQVARRLRNLGARPNTLVAVVMEKGWEQVIATLAILKSGAAYLPINPALPAERISYLLSQGEVSLALTQPWLLRRIDWTQCVKPLCIDELPKGSLYDEPLDASQRPDDLAYVIYTSGSTGLPKGVMIDHAGALNTILDINSRFQVGPGDRILALSDISFDLSVYDIFGALSSGATVVFPDSKQEKNPSHLWQLIDRERVTVWNSAPALMEMLVNHAQLAGREGTYALRLALLSGDWIPLTLPDQIRSLFSGIKVISLGGATEASIWSILYPIDRVDPDWKSIPYGRPMSNQRFYVMDDNLKLCPFWVPGHLYIEGIGVARGYWRDDERSRASFLHHPATGSRMYRTGDLGRYLPDGNIEFLGREDYQVKINGYRIEPGEIEAALLKHESVRSALVAAKGEAGGARRLVAYIVAGGSRPSPGELGAFLKSKLPSHMWPSAFVFLDEIPLSANGKVDRKLLPDTVTHAPAAANDGCQYGDSIEARVAAMAASALKVDHVARDADLIEAGANSLDLIKIASLIEKEFGYRPGLEEVYRSPTVATLAQAVRTQKARPNQLSLDLTERSQFKECQGAIRSIDGRARIELEGPARIESLADIYLRRSSRRDFSREAVSSKQLAELLGCLRQIQIKGRPKYLYASAGSLYPVQAYLHIKRGRVEGLDAGIYYYHPVSHSLITISPGAEISRKVHDPFINGPIFDRAAFSIFLIAQMSAITPLYGEHSLRFAMLEAGIMSQLLETTAPGCLVGLCQVGAIDFQAIRTLFDLNENHIHIHTILGGKIEPVQLRGRTPGGELSYACGGSEYDSEEGEL
jgi:amino acid adenylation domain-containing protein